MKLVHRLTAIAVLTLAAGVSGLGALAATPAGAEGPQTYLKFELKRAQVVSFDPQPKPPLKPVEDCHASPYFSECDESADPDFEPAPPTTPDCNPHPLVNVCDLTSDDGRELVQMRHSAADSFTVEVCKHDTAPGGISCKPDLD